MTCNFRCTIGTEPRMVQKALRVANVPYTARAQKYRVYSSQDNWKGGVQRLQQSILENAVSAMNGMISNLERTKATPAQKDWDSTDQYLQVPPSDEAIESFRLNIKAKANVLRPVIEIPGKGLEEYLSLPVEDYNSLDPQVVQFLGDNRFRLAPPFKEWFHINLHPEIILRIQPEPDHDRVLFVCESIKFGDSNMDKAGGLTFVSALSREEVTKKGVRQVFLMSLDTPYRASRMAPVRALEALSSRVLQTTLKACMGPYLDRLIVDYEDWAEGRPRRQEQIRPQETEQLFLEAQATVVEGFAAGSSGTGEKEKNDSDAPQAEGSSSPGSEGGNSGSISKRTSERD